MKLSHAYYHKGQFVGLPGDQWPEKSTGKYSGGMSITEQELRKEDEQNLKDYNDLLTSALDKALVFEDQEAINKLTVLDELIPMPIIPEGLYSFPEQDVEIVNYCPACNAAGMRNCAHFDKCGRDLSVLRIVSAPEMKTEIRTAYEIANRHAKVASGNDHNYESSWVVSAMKEYAEQETKQLFNEKEIYFKDAKVYSDKLDAAKTLVKQQHETITSKSKRIAELEEALRSITYTNDNGQILIGQHGDTEVPKIVYKALNP